MANLKEVRERIGSVKTTQQITKAMKLVAASKLKRAQDRITLMRPYADKLNEILGNIMSNVNPDEISLNFNEERNAENVLIVLVTSDKGLCGGYNSNLIKQTKILLNEKYAKQRVAGNVTLMFLGKKGFDALKREEVNIDKSNIEIFSDLTFENVAPVTEDIMKRFSDREFDAVECVYAQFKNAATQIYAAEQFLPIAKLESEEGNNTNADYIFEPEKIKLIEELVPKILKTQFYRYLLDANASEQGARMVAMDKATENANELLNDLKLVYNRERQAAITKEILEIVGGAAALEAG